MGRFEAFAERGRERAGEEATERFAAVLRRRVPGGRMEPRLIRSDSGITDKEDFDDLLEAAVEADVRLLEEVPVVRCPHGDCGYRVDLHPLREAADAGVEVECPDCHRPIDELDGLRVETRYALTEEAAVEAAAWQVEDRSRPKLRVAVLCAIRDELKQVRSQMEAGGSTADTTSIRGAGVYLTGSLAGKLVDWEIYAAMSEQTNAAAAASTIGAIIAHTPQVVIYLGIAGSLNKNVALGDVVAADVVHDYEVGKEKEPKKKGEAGIYEERPLQHRSSFQLMQWANVVSTSDDWAKRIIVHHEDLVTQPQVHTEPVAAGSKVVANSNSHTYRLIATAAPRAVAVEMEGAGFLLAVNRVSDIEGLLIRGISDRVDNKGGSDDTGWRHQAAANAAAFAFELLHQYQPPTQGTPRAA